ncbi:nucleotide exchange factor GrpE [bacterium]|nr:nucleotide exchange factor GrpE [bacterium]
MMSEHPEENLQDTEREKTPSGIDDPQAEGGEAPSDEEITEEASLEETLRKEVDEWRDKFLRKAAELENFRKRTRQDMENLTRAIRQSMILDFLPILDDFDRLLSIEELNDTKTFSEGARLIRDKLSAVFASLSVEKIGAEGQPFNHDEHDAVLTIETEDIPPDYVASVIQPGYKMNGRIIRHAQVVVSKAPESDTNSNDEKETS